MTRIQIIDSPSPTGTDHLTADERAEIARLLAHDKRIFYPTPGPQFEAFRTEADVIGYGGAAGGGKLVRLDEWIATPAGFTEMGNLQIGDQVLDKDGKTCSVRHVSPVEPAPELWEFLFDDGTKVVSCIDHQWLTFDADELASLTRRDPEWKAARRVKRPSRATGKRSALFTASIATRNARRAAEQDALPLPEGSVRTTRQIIETLTTPSGRSNHAVPVAKCLDLSPADLPIDPYVLGAWLGDGTTTNGGFTNIDPEINEQIKAAGFEMSHYADPKAHTILQLKPKLRAAGVLGFKHIPRIYLRASREQRLALLQGLMDTDGTVARHSGAAEFCNTNEQIIEGIHELICSLGWKVNRREGRAKLYSRDCGPKWTLKWVADEIVFRLPRKAVLQKLATRRTTKFRYIVDATLAPSEPGRCIQVDSPSSTYLIGRTLVPTHNTYLVSGFALTEHKRSVIFRQNKNQTRKFVQDFGEMIGNSNGYSSQNSEWKYDGRLIEFGGLEDPNDYEKWQGRDHDLKAYDEATQMREFDVRYTMGWNRSADPAQRCRTLLTFNPPTTAEGRWVIRFFAPWLDRTHPNPARDGEIRWFTTVGDNQDYECPSSEPFVILPVDGRLTPVYEFDAAAFSEEDIIRPKSRTFITARVTDNPYYMATGYVQQLQMLPEPLRSQMLKGDFMAGVEDSENQLIPTLWVELAQARWKDVTSKADWTWPEMAAMGVDAARGGNMGGTTGAVGKDKMVTACRHDGVALRIVAELIVAKGVDVNTGNLAAAEILKARRHNAPVQLDVAAIGTSVYDALCENNIHTVALNGAAASTGRDKSNLLKFANRRAEFHWRMREALDPENPIPTALPPDPELLADLTAPRYHVKSNGINVEPKADIKKRIGRSPDKGEAVLYANVDTPKQVFGTGQYANLPRVLQDRLNASSNYDNHRLDF